MLQSVLYSFLVLSGAVFLSSHTLPACMKLRRQACKIDTHEYNAVLFEVVEEIVKVDKSCL